MSAQSHYRSYLLRVWRLTTSGGPTWRIVLEDVVSKHQLTFTSLRDTASFLEAQLEIELDDTPRQPPDSDPGPQR